MIPCYIASHTECLIQNDESFYNYCLVVGTVVKYHLKPQSSIPDPYVTESPSSKNVICIGHWYVCFSQMVRKFYAAERQTVSDPL